MDLVSIQAHAILKRHRFHLTWLMVLERNCLWAVSSLFLPNGLERRNHHGIWASDELYFICKLYHQGPGPCMNIHIPGFQSLALVVHLRGPVPCLFWNICTFSFTLRTHRSLALWALSKFSFCFSWSWMNFCQIWVILTCFEGLERTVPCAGCPWRISAGEGRSDMMGVSCSWS